MVAEAAKGFDEGQAEEAIHKRYEKAHQHYFGELQKLTQANKNAGKVAEPDTDETPESAPPEDGDTSESETDKGSGDEDDS